MLLAIVLILDLKPLIRWLLYVDRDYCCIKRLRPYEEDYFDIAILLRSHGESRKSKDGY